MPEADLLRLCWDYHVNGNRSDALANEVYAIIDANMMHFHIEAIHGKAVAQECRQDCALRIFRYTIGRMMSASSKSGKVNGHSFIFQAAYFEVLQHIRSLTRRKAITFDQNDLNELLGRMVFDGDEMTIVKEQDDG